MTCSLRCKRKTARNFPTYSLLCLLCLLLCGTPLSAQNPPNTNSHDIRIEYFGLEKGYTTGMQPVTLLCTVRNKGNKPLPADTLRLRLSTVQGLEYTGGELRPNLPEMAPEQALSFRWLLTPLNLQNNLIIMVLLEARNPHSQTVEPQSSFALLHRFLNPPTVRAYVGKESDPPRARTNPAWVGNDRVAIQVVQTMNRNPLLLLQGKDGKKWLALGVATSLAEIMAAEEGQKPWADSFRVGSFSVNNDSDGATLSLTGMVGRRWNAELTFEAIRATGAIRGKLRLVARRTLRVFRVQLPTLLGTPETALASKADGSPLPVQEAVSPLSPTTSLSALLSNRVTFGVAWTNTATVPDWKWERVPIGDSQRAPLLGVGWLAPPKGDIIDAGATLEFSFRLFALGGSNSVQDALPMALP